jgi:hypothetical protein
MDGTMTEVIPTGLTDTLGIGYDSSSGQLWVGGADLLSRLDLSGNIEAQYGIAGTHTAVEVGDIGETPPPPVAVPEPASVALVSFGACALMLLRRRRVLL